MADHKIKITHYIDESSVGWKKGLTTFTMDITLDDDALIKCAKRYLIKECQRHARGYLKLGEEFGKISLFGKIYNYE